MAIASAGRHLATAASATARECLDGASYRALLAKAKYPVAALFISQSVLTFGLTAALARMLGSQAFGTLAVITTAAGIFQLIAGFPVESGTPKFLAEVRAREPRALAEHYGAGLWVRLAASALAVLAALPLVGWLAHAYGIGNLRLPLLVSVLTLCVAMPLGSYFMACIQGMERPARWATGNLLGAALILPTSLVGAWGFPRWGYLGLVAWPLGGWLAVAAVSALLARGPLGSLRPVLPRRERLEMLVAFLLPMWLIPLCGFTSRTLIKSALAWKWGPVPVGQLEIALSLLAHLGTVYQACMIVLLPEWARLYARREGKALLASIAQARGALLGMAVAYGAALALGGQWLVPAIFGAEQAAAVPAVRVIGLVMPVMITGWVTSGTYIVSNRTRYIGRVNLIWGLIVVPAALLLAWPLGALGAALGWLAAYLVFAWYYVSRARPFFAEVQGWAEEG